MHFNLLVLGSEVYHRRLIAYSIPAATSSISIRSGTTHKIQLITLAVSAHTTTTRACKNSNTMRIQNYKIRADIQKKRITVTFTQIMRKLDSLQPNLLEVKIVPCLYLFSSTTCHSYTIPVVIVHSIK